MTGSMGMRRPLYLSSLWLDVLRRMRHSRPAVVGALILLALILTALMAPWIAPHSPYKMNLQDALLPPNSPGYPLGSDELGRDNLSRLIYGSRVSLTVGLIVVGLAGGVGVTLGAISGYYGGIVDSVIMRLVDVLLAFPFLILAIVVVAVAGPSLINTMLALGGVSWVVFARLVRGQVLSLREAEYVQAAKVIGVRNRRIICQHILPNCLGVVLVQATFGVASAILAVAGLSFLGMGAQPPTAEWGAMLSTAKPYMRQRPLMAIAPGMAILITALAIHLVGDAMSDALEPDGGRRKDEG